MNDVFRAVGEATEEAIMTSMMSAEADRMLDGTPVPSLREWMKAEVTTHPLSKATTRKRLKRRALSH